MNILLIATSVILSSLSLYLINKEFLKKKLVDKIINRSSHNTVATRSGGVSIFFTLFIISTYYYFNNYEIYNFSILVPLGILLFVGMYDDLYNVDFKLKFIFQIIAAKILIDYGFVVDNLHGVFGIYEINRIFSQLLSIFIITAIINAINFIDGIDGLAITVVTLFIFLFESLSVKYTSFFNLSTIIVFSIIPALVFNYRKDNKVFLGDSGSLFLGGLLSVYIMHIISPEYLIRKTFDINKIFYVFSIFIYPTIDLCRIVFLRLIKGKSPFEADRNHIHHYLIDKFQDHHKVVIIIMIFSLIGFTSIHLLI
jgi:UDP-N-acetylmuramyl pentapeptide phosphotransferase/UDP-N-acetylglucosamine-1-phosphate transferase